MKKSKYNFVKRLKDRYFIVNCLYSCFFELSKIEYEAYNSREMFGKEDFSKTTFNKLKKNKFLIPEPDNELEVLRTRYKKEQESKDTLTVTIAPTLKCNFACRYCYENKSDKIIDNNDQVLILNFIENELKKKYKRINLIWFGGEPLLAFDAIKSLSMQLIKLTMKYGVQYKAFITTNGYLLTDKIARQLKQLKISQVFATLDGIGKVHDDRRNLVNGNGLSFKVIVSNIKRLKRYGVKVLIRMNIDKSNQKGIEPFRKYVNTKLKLPLYLGLIRSYTESCRVIDKECFTKEEYAHILDNFNCRQNSDKGLCFKFPRQLANYCRACKVGTYVIDPNLDLFKCENDIGRGDKKIGNIREYPSHEDLPKINDNRFLKWSPFDFKKCNDCQLLPICMGGCPYVGLKDGEPECEIYRYNFDSFLTKYLLEQNHES